MKRKTTEEVLAESFQEVAAKKAVNRITIKDIVSNCGLSSTTFYRYYRDKEDLIAWIYKRNCRAILERLKDSPCWWEEMVSEWINDCVQNRYFLINLLTNTGRYDAFVQHMVDITEKIIEDEITARSGGAAISKKDHVKLYLHTMGAVRLMCAWMLGKVSITQELAAEIISETGAPLIRALLPSPQGV